MRLTDHRGESETFALADMDGATSFVVARPGSDVVYERWTEETESYVEEFTDMLRERMNPYGLNDLEQKAVYFAMKPEGYDDAREYMRKATAKLVARGILVKDGAVYRTARPLMNRRMDIRVIGPPENYHPDADDVILDMPRPDDGKSKPIDRLVAVNGRYVSHEGVLVLVEALRHALDAGVLSKDRASTARKILKGLAPSP